MARRSVAQRMVNKIASAFPVALKREGRMSGTPLSAVRAFGVIFSNAANFTYDIPPGPVAEYCRELGLTPSRRHFVTNRAIQRARGYDAQRRNIFTDLRRQLAEAGDHDLGAALEAMFDLDPGCVAPVRRSDGYSVVPSNCHVTAGPGITYSFAQGSCTVLAVHMPGHGLFVAHYERKRLGELVAAAAASVQQENPGFADVFLIGDASVVDRVRPAFDGLRHAWHIHEKPTTLLYNLKMDVSAAGVTFYRSCVEVGLLFDGDFRRYGWDMALPFEPEPVRFS